MVLEQYALLLGSLLRRLKSRQDSLIEHVLEALLGKGRALDVFHGLELLGELFC